MTGKWRVRAEQGRGCYVGLVQRIDGGARDTRRCDHRHRTAALALRCAHDLLTDAIVETLPKARRRAGLTTRLQKH